MQALKKMKEYSLRNQGLRFFMICGLSIVLLACQENVKEKKADALYSCPKGNGIQSVSNHTLLVKNRIVLQPLKEWSGYLVQLLAKVR